MKTDKTIIWVFGGSGAGKNHFINHVIKNRPAHLLKQLGWENNKITVCQESLDWIPMNYQDPVIHKRKNLPTILNQLLKEDTDIILVKGQDWDLRQGTLERAQQLTTNATHSIIFLHVPILTAFKRWHKKPWKRFWYSPITVRRWLRQQLIALKKLNNISIISLESSTHDYPKIKFPPVI